LPIIAPHGVAGIITFDDLIISGMVDFLLLKDIVESQLEEPSEKKPGGITHPMHIRRLDDGERRRRKATRAQQTLLTFERRLQEALGLPNREAALKAFEVVADGMVRRLTPTAASAFIAQLPRKVQDVLLDLPAGPERGITLETIAEEMSRRLELPLPEARAMVERVGAVLPRLVSPGEVEHVRAQLPRELRTILPAAA
jgi:uncharacterized protein (DUF2267 family)